MIELLVTISIIGILVELLLPAVDAVREAAKRAQEAAELRQVALNVTSSWALHVDPNSSLSSDATLTLGFTPSNTSEPVGTTFRPCLQINCIPGAVITGTFNQTFILDPADFGPETVFSINAEADLSPGANATGGGAALLTWTGQPELTYQFVDIPEPSTIIVMGPAVSLVGLGYWLASGRRRRLSCSSRRELEAVD